MRMRFVTKRPNPGAWMEHQNCRGRLGHLPEPWELWVRKKAKIDARGVEWSSIRVLAPQPVPGKCSFWMHWAIAAGSGKAAATRMGRCKDAAALSEYHPDVYRAVSLRLLVDALEYHGPSLVHPSLWEDAGVPPGATVEEVLELARWIV